MKTRKIKYCFIPFPVQLDDYWLLNEDEKAILKKLIRLASKGWVYGDKSFAKSLRIGVYHLKRAKLRLKTLGLIRIEKRGPKHFAYFFQEKMEKWRPTKDVALKLKIDHEKMGYGELTFENEPFECKKHFEAYFKSQYPQLASGRKGRAKNPTSFEIEIPESTDEADDTSFSSPFSQSLTNLASQSPTKVLANYFMFRDKIDSMHDQKYQSEDPVEIKYFEKLELAADRAMQIDDDNLQKILVEVHSRLTNGSSNLEVSRFLENISRNEMAKCMEGSS